MIDKDAHALDPPLKRLGAPVFDLRELREREGGVLGRGAFGVVRFIEGYPGLAVKEARLDGLGESALRSLRFELATLTTFFHLGILRYYQMLEDGDFIYIIMNCYYDTLEKILIKHMRWREPVPIRMIVALAYLHSVHGVDANEDPYQEIVHRDLKPANILVSEDGNRLVLADFGLCRSAMTSSTTRVGSPAYMAPETLLEGKATPISDIWSLGVIIYELATLKRPNFLGDKEPRHVFTSGWRPDLSAIKDDFIRLILEKVFVLSSEKWPTARSFQELLNPSISSMGMLRLRIASLEDALGAAGARTGALGEAIAALKGRIDAQSAEIASLRAGNRVAALSEAERQSVQTSKSSLDLNKHRPSNPQAASRNAISLLRSLASKYGP